MPRRLVALTVIALAAVCSGCAGAVTGAPLSVATDAASLGGTVVSTTGGTTEYWAEYGPTRAYGSESSHGERQLAAGGTVPVEVAVGGLARSTAYHYRLCAKDADAGSCGEDRRLTTQSVACGDSVTVDVRLTGTLNCDHGPGLTAGADGITIDLAGHTLLNSGITSSFDDVTVRNGTVSGGALVLDDAARNRIADVEVTSASGSYAVSITGGTGNVVRGGSATARGAGLVVLGSPGTIVSGERLEGLVDSGAAIFSNGVTVTRNRIRGSSVGNPALSVAGSGIRVTHNVVEPGGLAGPVTGISVAAGAGVQLTGNQVSGFDPLLSGPASGDGIFVAAPANGTRLNENVVSANGGDGIEVRDTDARLRGNAADDNGDLGIEAVPGVTDLGGNTASGNVNPLQCANVFCL